MRIRKKILRYNCEVEDGRVFITQQPYRVFVGNKVVKVTRVYLGIFRNVIYNLGGNTKDESKKDE